MGVLKLKKKPFKKTMHLLPKGLKLLMFFIWLLKNYGKQSHDLPLYFSNSMISLKCNLKCNFSTDFNDKKCYKKIQLTQNQF